MSIENYGLSYDRKNASIPAVLHHKTADWSSVPTTTYTPGNQTVHANESGVKKATIDKVVSGADKFRPGYDPKILILPDGTHHVIDGHHRFAMHHAAGHTSFPAQVHDLRTSSSLPSTGTKASLVSAITAACHTRVCAPPPIGKGGSTPGHAERLAKDLVRQARENSTQITPTLRSIQRVVPGARMTGLAYRFKGKSSMARKIYSKAIDKGISQEEAASRISDALRFTYTLSAADYTPGTKLIVQHLKTAGFKPMEMDNYWRRGDDYNGINSTWVHTGTGQKVEIQFHTPEGIRVKETNHKLYERYRDPELSGAEKAQLFLLMVQNADSISRPRGVETIPHYVPARGPG